MAKAESISGVALFGEALAALKDKPNAWGGRDFVWNTDFRNDILVKAADGETDPERVDDKMKKGSLIYLGMLIYRNWLLSLAVGESPGGLWKADSKIRVSRSMLSSAYYLGSAYLRMYLPYIEWSTFNSGHQSDWNLLSLSFSLRGHGRKFIDDDRQQITRVVDIVMSPDDPNILTVHAIEGVPVDGNRGLLRNETRFLERVNLYGGNYEELPRWLRWGAEELIERGVIPDPKKISGSASLFGGGLLKKGV